MPEGYSAGRFPSFSMTLAEQMSFRRKTLLVCLVDSQATASEPSSLGPPTVISVLDSNAKDHDGMVS